VYGSHYAEIKTKWFAGSKDTSPLVLAMRLITHRRARRHRREGAGIYISCRAARKKMKGIRRGCSSGGVALRGVRGQREAAVTVTVTALLSSPVKRSQAPRSRVTDMFTADRRRGVTGQRGF